MAIKLREYKNPRDGMAARVQNWCMRNGICDVITYSNSGTRYIWDYFHHVNDDSMKGVFFQKGHHFYEYIEGGIERYNNITKFLADKYHAIDFIGMSAEGSLNYALHYHSDYKLEQKFTKFIAQYGYCVHCIENCFYILYRLPHEYDDGTPATPESR